MSKKLVKKVETNNDQPQKEVVAGKKEHKGLGLLVKVGIGLGCAALGAFLATHKGGSSSGDGDTSGSNDPAEGESPEE